MFAFVQLTQLLHKFCSCFFTLLNFWTTNFLTPKVFWLILLDLESFLNTHNFLLQIFLWAKRPNKVYDVWSFLSRMGIERTWNSNIFEKSRPPLGFQNSQTEIGIFVFISPTSHFPNFCIYFSDASPPLSCFLAAQKALDLLEGGLRFDM